MCGGKKQRQYAYIYVYGESIWKSIWTIPSLFFFSIHSTWMFLQMTESEGVQPQKNKKKQEPRKTFKNNE